MGGIVVPKGWVGKPSPKSQRIGGGWLGEMDRAYVDESRTYAVMIRTVKTEWGDVEHAAIRNADNTDIPWFEKQRIKNEIFGVERVAIEVFPAESQLVDAAMMYHIWVLPKEMNLPFTIKGAIG